MPLAMSDETYFTSLAPIVANILHLLPAQNESSNSHITPLNRFSTLASSTGNLTTSSHYSASG